METSCRRLAGRVFQNFGPEKFIVDFLAFVLICLYAFWFLSLYLCIFSVRKNIDDIFCGSWKCVTVCINMPI